MTTQSAAGTRRALVLGNSDGIGKAFVEHLLADGWQVTGFSRSPVAQPSVAQPSVAQPSVAAGTDPAAFHHTVGDVAAPDFRDRLRALAADRGPFELCAFCVAIAGEHGPLDFVDAERVIRTNFNGLLHTLEVVLPGMRELPPDRRGCRGQVIVLSSMADALRVPDSGAYSSSKAGLSNYATSLGLHLRSQGIRITNVRFGFVDTKMARAPVRPFLMTTDRAARILMGCVRRRPLQCSPPWIMAWIVAGMRALQTLQIRWLSLWR